MLNKDILTWIVDHKLSELERILETIKSNSLILQMVPLQKLTLEAGVYLLERGFFVCLFVFYVKAECK